MPDKKTPQPSAKSMSWTRYWRSGFRDTCFFADKTFSVAADWRNFFSSAGKGAKIVDLATGNGAVAMIAAQVNRDLHLEASIVGVDFADIAPQELPATTEEPLQNITFIGNTDLADLPFQDAQFDLASSQFGFEYAEQSGSLSELKRVLKPGGQVRMLIHATEGAVHEASVQRLRRARSMLESGQILPLLEELAKAVNSSAKTRIPKIQKRITTKVGQVQRKFGQLPKDDLVLELCSEAQMFVNAAGKVPASEFVAKIRHLSEEVRAYTLRLHAMHSAARTSVQMQALCEAANTIGFQQSRFTAYNVEDQQVGWIFHTQVI